MPHTLLLADDSVTIQRVIELTFADEDIRVVAVSDGNQAIARVEEEPPDIVLADVGMPGRNGYEVAKYIKETPRLAHIPVVLLTGAFEPIDRAKASAAGCDGVLAKPFEPQLVIGRVKELLARPRRTAPSLDADLSPPPSGAPGSWTAPLVGQRSTLPRSSRRRRSSRLLRSPGRGVRDLSERVPSFQDPLPRRPWLVELDWFASQPPPNATLAMRSLRGLATAGYLSRRRVEDRAAQPRPRRARGDPRAGRPGAGRRDRTGKRAAAVAVARRPCRLRQAVAADDPPAASIPARPADNCDRRARVAHPLRLQKHLRLLLAAELNEPSACRRPGLAKAPP